MYGYQEAELLVERELQLQHRLATEGSGQVLHVPLLLGPVGGGKSAIGRGRAIHWDLTYCPINCGENSDATDVSGVPLPAFVRNLMSVANDPLASNARREEAADLFMEWVLNKYAALSCKQPVFLFFDDLDKAPPPVQSAMLGIAGTRMFRDRPIHPGTLLMGAGNRVEDDEYANQISESMRTRMTIIEMKPDITSFSAYAQQPSKLKYEEALPRDKDEKSPRQIHPTVLGYLQYKGEHLHQWKEGVNRFPTPRGWWEVSRGFYSYSDPREDIFKSGRKENWKGIVARKCGSHVANDFWAWFEIISKVDVQKLLTTGKLDYTGDAKDIRMAQYAAIFAVAQALVKEVKPSYKGLQTFIDSLQPEMRVGLVVQLPLTTRSKIASIFEDAAEVMMSDIVKTSKGPKLVSQPQGTP